jgi:hypothetical protein
MEMTSRQRLDSVDQALAEVARRLESGEIDGSGRYYSDAELAAGAATGRSPQSSQAVTEDAVICTKHVSAA